jgi:AraC-like DNA-binding protein
MAQAPVLSVVRHPALPGLEAVAGVRVAADIVAHAHSALVVGLCLAGGRRIVSGGGQWRIQAGEGFVVPAGVRHACAPLDAAGHGYLALAVRPDVLLRAGVAAGAPEVWVRSWRDACAAGLLRRVVDQLTGDAGTADDVLTTLAALAACLGLRPGLPPPPHPATRLARAAMDADPAAGHSLSALARLAGVGETYLERVFARDVGMPVGQYLLTRRVRLAAATIARGAPLAEAALAAGFYDQSHLTRHFRQRMGVPPGSYSEGIQREPPAAEA